MHEAESAARPTVPPIAITDPVDSLGSLACRRHSDSSSHRNQPWEPPSVYTELQRAGFFAPRDPSLLQLRIEQVIDQNILEIRAAIDRASASGDYEALLAEGAPLSEIDLAALTVAMDRSITTMSCTVLVMCVVAAGIAAAVVTYVSVVTAVTVAITAAIAVSAVMLIAVTVGGWRMSSVGAFSRLDPSLVRNTELALRLGTLGGDRGLQLHAVRTLIIEEVTAVMGAMQRKGLITLSADSRQTALDAMVRYAHRVVGV